LNEASVSTYQVVVTITQRMTYVVEATSENAAEDLTEELIADGLQPNSVDATETVINDVVLVEDSQSDSTGFFQ
jgi:hypothetical protein